MTGAGAAVTPLIVPVMVEDDWTADEIRAHLKDHHKSQPYSHNSKTTKPELITWHNQVHSNLETGTEQQQARAGNSVKIPHVHRAMTAEDLRAEGGFTLDLTKPLTAAEAKDLRGLIDNDFNALVQDMRAMAADTKRDRLEVAEKEWSRKKDQSEKYREDARRLIAEVEVKASALKEKALKDGVELTFATRYSAEPNTVLVGKSNAMKAIEAEVTNDLNRALMVLERQRLAAHRTVILAKITPAAHAVLQTVPDAKALMVEAAQERQTHAAVEA